MSHSNSFDGAETTPLSLDEINPQAKAMIDRREGRIAILDEMPPPPEYPVPREDRRILRRIFAAGVAVSFISLVVLVGGTLVIMQVTGWPWVGALMLAYGFAAVVAACSGLIFIERGFRLEAVRSTIRVGRVLKVFPQGYSRMRWYTVRIEGYNKHGELDKRTMQIEYREWNPACVVGSIIEVPPSVP